MAANFPTSLDDDTTVGGNSGDNPASTDPTTTPSHSELHQDVGDAVQAIEAKVGTGSSTAGSDQVLAGTGSGTSAWTALTASGDVTGTLASGDIAMTIAADSIEQSMMSLNWTSLQWTSETTQVTQNEVAINTDGAFVYMELGALGIISGRVSFNATGATGAIKVDVPGTGATSSAQYMNGSFRLAVPGASHCGQVSGNVSGTDYFTFLQHDTASTGTSLPAVGNTSVLDFWAIWYVG